MRRNSNIKICTICNKRPVNKQVVSECANFTYCRPCLTEADWENMHSDFGHDGNSDVIVTNTEDEYGHRFAGCWICFPELNEAAADYTPPTPRTGAAPIAKSYTSHAGCNHPRTPRDRAKCRATRRNA